MTQHDSHALPREPPSWFARTFLSVAAVGAWLIVWLVDVSAASSYGYFEPTDEALRTADRGPCGRSR